MAPLRLLLIRHAAAAPERPSGSDFERPLTSDGLASARRLGQLLALVGDFAPKLVAVSTAARTESTADILCHHLPGWSAVRRSDERLYLASRSFLGTFVRGVPVQGDLVVIGHNPGLSECAAEMAGRLLPSLDTGAAVLLGFPSAVGFEKGQAIVLERFAAG
jgi:phosphohistidine phosphatase